MQFKQEIEDVELGNLEIIENIKSEHTGIKEKKKQL